MKNRIFSFALLLSIIVAAGAVAQNLPGGIWASPQSNATEGRLRSNADDFIRPDTYTSVRFDKMFALLSFLWDENYNPIVTAGFSAKINSLYIGAFYSGNFWTNAPANNYTELMFDPAPAGGKTGSSYNYYNNISVVPEPVNNASILIGVADMGFRLTYRSNHQYFNNSDIVTRNPFYNNPAYPLAPEYQLYKNYHAEEGYIAPQVAWAMAKDLSENGIRPYATVDLVFNRNYQMTKTSGADSSGFTGDKIDHASNSFNPELSAGLGGYTFYRNNGLRASADFDYSLALNIYENDYSYGEAGTYKIGRIKGTYNPRIVPFEEKFYVSNSFTPSVSCSWSSDRAALRLRLDLLFSFSTDKANAMELDTANNLVYHGNSNTTNTFTFLPNLRLAFQYKIIPDRLSLNTGARIQSTGIISETIDRAYYNNGTKSWSQRIHQNSFGGSGNNIASRFHLGLTFIFTENIWIEAMSGIRNAYGNDEAIDIFAPGGLFSFGSLLFALKF